MLGVAACFFVAGSLLGALVLRLTAPKSSEVATTSASAPTISIPSEATTAGQPANSLSSFSAKVVSITDGDTVDVLGPRNLTYAIRLAGIDAPEHDQAFGRESTQHLSELLSGKTITLDCENERSYSRLICKIVLRNVEDVCLDQVKAGMAWHYKQYQDEQSPADREAYAAAECAAMKSKLGLWSDPHPVQPQDFRHGTNSSLLLDAKGCRTSSEPTSGAVVGNARSHIFEWPACPYYSNISPDYQVPFPSPQAAEAAGYRPAHNCP
jgi:endonuclease YncB( thermonuclease family)